MSNDVVRLGKNLLRSLMGDGENTNIGDLGEHREWCSILLDNYPREVVDSRSKEHFNPSVFKGDKQQKRDSYNDYLKKVVK